MNHSFEYITTLEYRLKAAQVENALFKSGKKYTDMQTEYLKNLRHSERIIVNLKNELSKSHSEAVDARNKWFQVFEDLEKEYQEKTNVRDKQIKKLEIRLVEAEQIINELKDKVKEQRLEIYDIAGKLEDEKGKNLKLKAQINRDYENSSIPSSKSLKNKKISNSREVTGRKPGGQPGHIGHCRKKQTPTEPPILLAAPQNVIEDSDFKKTSKTIVKQYIGIRLMLDVKEYHADVYYNSKTGEHVHAEFPEGVVNEVNYDSSIKAFLFLLNNECCTSIDKSSSFLSDLTGGRLNISKGMINKLCHEFADKTKQEQKTIFANMLLAPVMHTDNTNAKVNGKSAYVFVCATPDGQVIYSASGKKGHEGVKGTVAEHYQGILVHDHDLTFYNYGSEHQECLAHILRYLKDSMSNEPELTWNTEMHSLVREMIHYRNSLPPEADCCEATISDFENRYMQILQIAKNEYEYVPPNKYYREGYNLYLRMEKYMKNHLLFLKNKKVPATNNEAERLLRSYKRKQTQAVSFRSQSSIDYLCQCMSMLVMMRKNKECNIFEEVRKRFE